MSQNGFNIKATIALISALLCWSTVPLFLRSFIHEIDAWVANGFRYPLMAFFWFFPLVWMIKTKRITNELLKLAIIPTIINVLAQICLATAPYYIEPGLMMFIARISILFSITFSFIVFSDERSLIYSPFFWVGLFVCICGFIGLNMAQGNFSSETTTLGIIITVLHALFIGMYAVSIRYFMRGIKPWYSFPVICIYTSIILFILMWIFGDPYRLLEMEPHRLGVLVISAIVGIAVAHVAYYYALENIGVSISSSSGLIMPFLTAIGSYYIFREVFTFGQLASGVIMLFGAGLLLWAQQHLGVRHKPVVSSNIPEVEEFASVDDSDNRK